MTMQQAIGPYGTCVNLTQAFVRNETQVGVTVGYIPYTQCMQHCPGWRRYSTGQIVMVLSQFILPAAIFAFLLPRGMYLLVQFRFNHRQLRKGTWAAIQWALNCSFAFVADGSVSFLVTVLDMIFWIGLLMTIPGPILWETVSELVLDYRIKTSLVSAQNPQLRLDLLLALLCGNFSYNGQSTRESRNRIKEAFDKVANEQPRQAKACLLASMNSQAPFASVVGIPTLFFLGGFLYNTLTMNDLTAAGYNWTPYAIWLMLIVYIAVASTASATGSNPSALEPLLYVIDENEQPAIEGWRKYIGLAYFYPGNLQPVNIWDRGCRKDEWLQLSDFRNDPEFPKDLSLVGWAGVGTLVLVLTSFPTFMAFLMAHILPWPHFGCRSISYLSYGAAQIVLIIATASRNRLRLLFAQPRSLCSRILIVLSIGGPLLVSFLFAFPGSVFQVFGVYNNCLCRTDPRTWRSSYVDMWTTLGILGQETDEYTARSVSFALNMTWTAVVFTTAVCFAGWWYQKTISAATREGIRKL